MTTPGSRTTWTTSWRRMPNYTGASPGEVPGRSIAQAHVSKSSSDRGEIARRFTDMGLGDRLDGSLTLGPVAKGPIARLRPRATLPHRVISGLDATDNLRS